MTRIVLAIGRFSAVASITITIAILAQTSIKVISHAAAVEPGNSHGLLADLDGGATLAAPPA